MDECKPLDNGPAGGSMIRGAMNHDAIMNAPTGRDNLAGGQGAAAEAERVARRAQAGPAHSFPVSPRNRLN